MDNEQKHTPGPWQISKSPAGKNGTSHHIWRNDEGPDGPEDTNTNWSRIAQHIHSEADARLIAAAPRMLHVLEMIHTYGLADELEPAVRAVLKLAKGTK
jgi:hypothetical protein